MSCCVCVCVSTYLPGCLLCVCVQSASLPVCHCQSRTLQPGATQPAQRPGHSCHSATTKTRTHTHTHSTHTTHTQERERERGRGRTTGERARRETGDGCAALCVTRGRALARLRVRHPVGVPSCFSLHMLSRSMDIAKLPRVTGRASARHSVWE